MATQQSTPMFGSGFGSMTTQIKPTVNPFAFNTKGNAPLFPSQNTNAHIASWSTPTQITNTQGSVSPTNTQQADNGHGFGSTTTQIQPIVTPFAFNTKGNTPLFPSQNISSIFPSQNTNAHISSWSTPTQITNTQGGVLPTNTQQADNGHGFGSTTTQIQPTVTPFAFNTNAHIGSSSTPTQITNTQGGVSPTNTQQADKGQIIQCLNDSKNIQIEILKQLNLLNQKNVTQQTKIIHTHTGVSCNGCMKPIIYGMRYKCIFCRDFDFCEECEVNLASTHDSTHSFIKIKDTNNFNMMIHKVIMFNIPEPVIV
jgi:hypothetical protein